MMNSTSTDSSINLDHFLQVLKKHRTSIMEKANVVDVTIGLKESKGKHTGEIAIVVYVDKKVSPKKLFVDDLIEEKLDGVPVDIQIAPSFRSEKELFKPRTRWQRFKEWAIESFIPGLLFIVLLVAFFLPNILKVLNIPFTADQANNLYDYLIVVALGMSVGLVEIISRYQDEPFQTVKSWPGLIYMLLNGLVAASALWLIRLFGWNFLPTTLDTPTPNIERWSQVMISGLGAMAFFRSSLFNLGMGDTKVSVGPSAVLDILLNTIDKAVDRFRAQQRAKLVRKLMQNIPFKAYRELHMLGTYLMQNLPQSEKDMLKKDIDAVILTMKDLDTDVKKHLIGLRLMNYLGPDVIKQAVEVLGEEKYAETLDAETWKPSAPPKTEQAVTPASSQLKDLVSELRENLPQDVENID